MGWVVLIVMFVVIDVVAVVFWIRRRRRSPYIGQTITVIDADGQAHKRTIVNYDPRNNIISLEEHRRRWERPPGDEE